MDDKAKALAQALLDSNKTSEYFEFNVNGSTDRVIVTVVRTNQERIQKGIRILAERASVSFYGSGSQCPTCSGTGRI